MSTEKQKKQRKTLLSSFSFLNSFYAVALRRFVRLDFLLAAVFLCRIPFAEAWSIFLIAKRTASCLLSALVSTAKYAFLIAVLRADFAALLRAVLVAITFTRFFADLMFAIVPPP